MMKINWKALGPLFLIAAALVVFFIFIEMAQRAGSGLPEKNQEAASKPLDQKEDGEDVKRDNPSPIDDLFNRIAAASASLNDYTCIVTKRERVGAMLLPEETIFIKQRKEPFSVYMKWIEDPFKGRECLYCEGRYSNRLQAHEGQGLLSLIGSLSLDPQGGLAMKDARHPITEAGIFNAMSTIKRDYSRAKKHPEHGVRYEFLEEREVHGQPSICVLALHPRAESFGYYSYKAEICIHKSLYLPTALTAWDSTEQITESYTFREFKTNAGLTEADFDIENEAYNF